MKIKVSKDWCMRMAELEGDSEIGAGPLARDPVPDDEQRSPIFGLRQRGPEGEPFKCPEPITCQFPRCNCGPDATK